MTASQTNSALVLGCKGQVGQELLARSSEFDISATGLDVPDIDITDRASVEQAIAAFRPNVILNAAAYTAVDKAEAEPDLAFAVNAHGPRLLAEVCAAVQIPLFHISTDYVYNGAKPSPYHEDDLIAPLGVYGRSKADGDEAIRKALETHIILRTTWVFSAHGENFVKTMLRLAAEHDQLQVVNDQHGCPTAAGDIAGALLTMVRFFFNTPEAMADKWGTYHYSCTKPTTWHGFAHAIIAGFAARGGRSVPVVPISTDDYPTLATRPANSVLDCSKIEETFVMNRRAWPQALDETLDQLISPRPHEETE